MRRHADGPAPTTEALPLAERPLRVLIVRHGYFPADPRVRREVTALVSRGHEVDVVCLREPGQDARETVAGARVVRLPIGHRRASSGRYLLEYGAFGASAAATVAALHLRRRYDLVQVNTMPDALVFAALAPKLAGASVLLDLHEVMPELYASKFGVPLSHPLPRLLAATERLAVDFADACIAVSRPCLDRYVDRGSPPDKFTVVMNTPDPQLFARVAAAPEPDGSGGRAPTAVSHGTLVERYGFDLLLTAVAELPGVRLDIVGDGEERPRLEREAESLGIDDRVAFTGRVAVDAVAERIRRADVGVVANRRDEFTDLVVPTKLLEYVAVGVPAVAARTPAVEEYFDGRAIQYFRAGDARDLARALGEVLGDPERRREMVEEADRQFNARYGGSKMHDRYADLVERSASRARDLRTRRG